MSNLTGSGHKLGEHYQFIFSEWNVDCEFNRNLFDPKQVSINVSALLKQMADQLANKDYSLVLFDTENSHKVKQELINLESQLRDPKNIEIIEELGVALFTLTLVNGKKLKKTIYPDIIIHHRGTRNNHIVVECKKTINKDPRDRAYDLIKLITLVNSPDFLYRAGFFIDLPVGTDINRFKQFSDPIAFAQDVFCISPEY